MADSEQIAELFKIHSFPDEDKELQTIASGEITLTHYTSADAAYNIISSEKIFLGDARFTNDFSEINYGSQLFLHAFREKYLHLYKELFDKIDPNLFSEFDQIFSQNIANLLFNNYIFCLCGHDSLTTEHRLHGKLSMWRAYGGKSGVCFYFNENISKIELPNSTFSKVNYWSYNDLEYEMSRFYSSLNVKKHLNPSNKSIFLDQVVNKFKNDLAFIKNPSFKEENEWRLLCFPDEHNDREYNVDNVILRNTPQMVVSIPFCEKYKTSFNEILSHIVIGPSPNQQLVQR
jgi:hypothetical protein